MSVGSDLFDPLAEPFRIDGDRSEAVVLTHGFTGTPAAFRPLAEHLAEHGYTVVAPLLAGHGTTIEDMGDTGAEDWLSTLRDAVRSVADHRRVHLVGISMGGLLSIHVAADLRPASLTVINSPVRFRSRQAYLAPFLHRLRPLVLWEASEPDLDAEVRPLWLTYPGFPTHTMRDLVSLAMSAPRRARTLGIPALVIQSRTDESVHPSSGEILARSLRCRIVWLEDSLHMSLLDRERHIIHDAVLERVTTA